MKGCNSVIIMFNDIFMKYFRKEDKCEPFKKAIQENENMTTINQFLKDLSKLIDKC